MADPFPEKFLKVSGNTVGGGENAKAHNKITKNQDLEGLIINGYSSNSSMAVHYLIRKSLRFIFMGQAYSFVVIVPKGLPGESLAVQDRWLEHRLMWDNKT